MRKFSSIDFSKKNLQQLLESKKAAQINVLFLSASAEKITKSSNSMFAFKSACEKAGLNFMTVDPSSARIDKGEGDNYTITEYGEFEHQYTVSPKNTIIVPRRTVLKNSESKDFLLILQGYGFFCFNTLDAFESCEDKFTTYRRLKQNNVPTPRTAIVTPSSLKKLDSKVNEVGGNFPLVVKILNGTQGVGVFICESMMSLRSTLQALFHVSPKSDIIIQEKIESEYDLRIHVIYKGFEKMSTELDNYEVIGCMRRNVMDGDFRSNFSLGATAEKGFLTEKQKEIAKKAAKATGCRWCGVDLITDKHTNESYVIEVNSSPGTKGITTMAGDDVVGTIFNMFKDFKYTNYNIDAVGKFEQGKIKDLGNKDVTINFDSSIGVSKLCCTSIQGFEDSVKFVHDGTTYELPIVGNTKTGDFLVELNVSFNGTIYKNELVQLIKSDESKCFVAGSKFLSRLGNGMGIQPNQSFIYTDNTLDFVVPQAEEILNEGRIYETQNWLFNCQDEDIKMSGFKQMLEAFDSNGKHARRGKWEIGRGGYDLQWEVYYNGVPFMECVDNEATFQHDYMPYKIACKIAGVIESVYPDVKVNIDETYGDVQD